MKDGQSSEKGIQDSFMGDLFPRPDEPAVTPFKGHVKRVVPATSEHAEQSRVWSEVAARTTQAGWANGRRRLGFIKNRSSIEEALRKK